MLIDLLSKHYPGMRFWLLQRITAVYMAVYLPVLILHYWLVQPQGYEAWLTFNSPLWWRVLSCLFFFSLCLHAWVGVRDVFRDYLPNQVLQAFLQAFVELVLIACLIWSVYIFWSI